MPHQTKPSTTATSSIVSRDALSIVEERQGGDDDQDADHDEVEAAVQAAPDGPKAPSGGPDNAALTSTSPPASAGHSGSGDCSPEAMSTRATRYSAP